MIDESHPYVAARLGLIKYVARNHGVHGLPIDEAARAKDRTTKLVSAWLTARDEEAKLRQQTLTCITFLPAGKIEVHNKPELEDLNGKINELSSKRIAADAAIVTLQEKEPSFLCDLKAQVEKAERTISEVPLAVNKQLGIEITEFNAPDVETAMQRPRYLRLKATLEPRMADAKAKLAELEPRIELVRSQCEAV